MSFLRHIDNLRIIDWGQKYFWDIKFPDAPFPFNDFFPASSVSEELAVLETFEFDRYLSRYPVPKASGPRKLTITFFDDDRYSLQIWLKNWVNKTILKDGYNVATLKSAVKDVLIVRQNRTRQDDVMSMAYSVFPFGTLTYEGSSNSDPIEYTMSFYIANVNEHYKFPQPEEKTKLIDIYTQKSETKLA